MSDADGPPPELFAVVNPHIEKVRPGTREAKDEVVFYSLHIQGAAATAAGDVKELGEGTFIGPLDPDKRAEMYDLYPHHATALRSYASGPSGAAAIVTCEITVEDATRIHFAVVGLR